MKYFVILILLLDLITIPINGVVKDFGDGSLSPLSSEVISHEVNTHTRKVLDNIFYILLFILLISVVSSIVFLIKNEINKALVIAFIPIIFTVLFWIFSTKYNEYIYRREFKKIQIEKGL